jgi:hypothetical protein
MGTAITARLDNEQLARYKSQYDGSGHRSKRSRLSPLPALNEDTQAMAL